MYKNCTQCPHHSVIPDPDLDDWFNTDDVAVVCVKMKNENQDVNSNHVANRQEFRLITAACRPYNTKKESEVPSWCPLEVIKIQEKVEDF